MASRKKRRVAITVPFADLRVLLGRGRDDDDVVALIGRSGPTALQKPPDRRRVFVAAPDAGFDLGFVRPQLRGPFTLQTIFVYADDVTGHAGFVDLPFGAVDGPRDAVRRGIGPPLRTTPLDDFYVDSDHWEIDGLAVTARYFGVIRDQNLRHLEVALVSRA